MIGKLLEQKIAWSTLIQLAGKAGQMILGFMTVKVLTTALGVENYGLYGKITEFSLFFSTIGNLGIFGNLIRKLAEKPEDTDLFWNAFLLRLGTAFFFFGIGLAYAIFKIHDTLFLLGTTLFMSSLLLDYLSSICDGALQVQYRMGRATAALLAGRLINLLTIVFLFYGLGTDSKDFQATSYLLGPLLGSLVTLGLSLYFVKQKMTLRGLLNKTLQKELLWSSLPFGIINILNSLYYRFIPSALLIKILSDGEYSTYSLGLHLSSTLALFSTLFMFSVLPALKQALHDGHSKTAKELVRKATKILGFLALAMIVGGSLLGPFALTAVSNNNFLAPQLWFILPLLLALAGVSYFYDLSFITLFALGKDRWWLKREGLALSLSISISTLSFLAHSIETKIILILSAAIAAEAAMALMGLYKIHQDPKLNSKPS